MFSTVFLNFFLVYFQNLTSRVKKKLVRKEVARTSKRAEQDREFAEAEAVALRRKVLDRAPRAIAIM